MSSAAPAGWAHVKLGEVAEFRNGINYNKSNFGKGIPVISVKDFWERSFPQYDSLEEINPDGVVRPEHALKNGDILFVRSNGNRDLIGRSLFIRNLPARPVTHSAFTIRVRFTSRHAEPRFFAYLFRSPIIRQVLSAQGNGANISNLNQDILTRLTVALPPIGVQHSIAAILSAYDDLIENNTRRIAILEEMARRIYEEWFVRFRFPGHEGVRMVESALGLVPMGWSVQGLYDVADLTYGFPFKSNLFKEGGEGLGVIRIRDIRDDHTATRTTEDVDLKYRVTDGDILVGMDGAFHMGRWAGGVAWLNQRVVRFCPKARIPRSWLFWVTKEPIKTLEATIVGTTVAHLSARDLKEMRVLVPPTAVLEGAGCVLEPMSDLELTLKKKNAVLRATRDLLLPKLISGELDVSAVPEPQPVAA